MRDPGTDANLAAYANSLTTATWESWQVVHLRAETASRPVILFQSLISRVGEDQANAISRVANMAGASVNSLVLGYFLRQAQAAAGQDPRLAATWLDILEAHSEGPHTGTVVRGAWGILLRDLLVLDARNECYQPFARAVEASVFGLEEIQDSHPS
jgi:hypothetical protein